MLFESEAAGPTTQAQLDAISEVPQDDVWLREIKKHKRPLTDVIQLSLIDSLITRGDKDGQNAYIQAVHQRGIGPGDGA